MTAKPVRLRGDGRMYESLAFADRPPMVAAKTAVVVVDMTNTFLSPSPAPGQPSCLSDLRERGVPTQYFEQRLAECVVPAHARLLSAARAAGATVVFTRAGCFRADAADAVKPLQAQFRRWKAQEGEWAVQVDPRIAVEPGDISLLKTGSGSFHTSALDSHLRNRDIEHVIYTGVVTNGCVLLSVAGGYDRSYHGYFASDATATFSDALQTATEDIISGYMAPVLRTNEIIEMLSSARAAA